MKRYLKIWWMLTLNATQQNLASRFGAVLLIVGKVIRFFFFLFFLIIIGTNTKLIAGYTLPQMIFFFLTYQLVDTIPQFFLREVYRFRGYVVSGDFDYFLSKPISPLFRALFGGTDVLDIPMIFLTIFFLIPAILQIWHNSYLALFSYVIFILNAFVIALAFHIIVLALGVVTTEVDNAIMFYRDMTQMGRVPVDVYQEPLRGFITFIIPVGIMMTIPAKGLLELLSVQTILIAFAVSIGFFLVSRFFWNMALKEYASASS